MLKLINVEEKTNNTSNCLIRHGLLPFWSAVLSAGKMHVQLIKAYLQFILLCGTLDACHQPIILTTKFLMVECSQDQFKKNGTTSGQIGPQVPSGLILTILEELCYCFRFAHSLTCNV